MMTRFLMPRIPVVAKTALVGLALQGPVARAADTGLSPSVQIEAIDAPLDQFTQEGVDPHSTNYIERLQQDGFHVEEQEDGSLLVQTPDVADSSVIENEDSIAEEGSTQFARFMSEGDSLSSLLLGTLGLLGGMVLVGAGMARLADFMIRRHPDSYLRGRLSSWDSHFERFLPQDAQGVDRLSYFQSQPLVFSRDSNPELTDSILKGMAEMAGYIPGMKKMAGLYGAKEFVGAWNQGETWEIGASPERVLLYYVADYLRIWQPQFSEDAEFIALRDAILANFRERQNELVTWDMEFMNSDEWSRNGAPELVARERDLLSHLRAHLT